MEEKFFGEFIGGKIINQGELKIYNWECYENTRGLVAFRCK